MAAKNDIIKYIKNKLFGKYNKIKSKIDDLNEYLGINDVFKGEIINIIDKDKDK